MRLLIHKNAPTSIDFFLNLRHEVLLVFLTVVSELRARLLDPLQQNVTSEGHDLRVMM